MKKLLFLLTIIVLTFSVKGQKNEQDCLKNKHIDWKTEYIYFELSGLIEINGHIFNNDTCKVPVIWSATVNKITISKGEIEYTVRDCGDKDCKILHLVEKETGVYYPNHWLELYRHNNYLYNIQTNPCIMDTINLPIFDNRLNFKSQ